MFGKRHLGKQYPHQNQDEGLSALLRQWKSVEPRITFETTVWRRIRIGSGAESRRLSILGLLRDWIPPQPAWAAAVAATAAVIVGVWGGLSAPQTRASFQASDALLHSQTLAGSYLALASGGKP